jgi:hypothetical protein
MDKNEILVQEEDFYFFIGIKMKMGDDWPVLARFAIVVSIKQRTKSLESNPYRQALIYEALSKIQNLLQLSSDYFWCVEGLFSGMKN